MFQKMIIQPLKGKTSKSVSLNFLFYKIPAKCFVVDVKCLQHFKKNIKGQCLLMIYNLSCN